MAIFQPKLKPEHIHLPYRSHWKPFDKVDSSAFAGLSHNDKKQGAGLIISAQSSHYSGRILHLKPYLPYSLIPASRVNYQPAFLESQAEALCLTEHQHLGLPWRASRVCSLVLGAPVFSVWWRSNAPYLQSCTSECQSHSPLPAPAPYMIVFLMFFLESRYGDGGTGTCLVYKP